MTLSGRSRWQSIVTLIVFGMIGAGVHQAAAQSYKSIPTQVPQAEVSALAGKVGAILRAPNAPSPADIELLDRYFMKHLYPTITQYEPPSALGNLSASRDILFKRFIDVTKSQATRDHVIAGALKAMGAIAKGGFHPAVRYNAVLIIGQLDQTPGKPLPAATEALVTILENEEFNKVAVPTALKVGALIGLQRHVAAGVEPAIAERITKAALAVASREEAPDDATPKVYGWVRKQAAKLVTAQQAKGLTPEVHQELVALLSDKTIDLDDRCGIAQLLKPDMFKTAQGLDSDAMAVALGDLAKRVLDFESDKAQDYLEEVIGSGNFNVGTPGGGMMGRGFGGEGGGGGGMGAFNAQMPIDMGPKYEKRRMIDRTLAIADGADAAANAGSDETKAKLTELAKMIRTVALAAADDKAVNEDVTDSVIALSKNVTLLVANWSPAAAAAGEDEAAEDEFLIEGDDEEAPADEAVPAEEAAPAEKVAPADAAPAAEEPAPAAEAPAPAPAG